MSQTPEGRKVIQFAVTLEVCESADEQWQREIGQQMEGVLTQHLDSIALALEHGGPWGEHPDHPITDWLIDAQCHETRQGYWDWVRSRLSPPSPSNPTT